MSDYLSGINSISSSYAYSTGSISNSQALTDETKKKLEALGVDTKNIKTEKEGQEKLQEAQAAQENQQLKNDTMVTFFRDVKKLASDVGIYISSENSLQEIFYNLQQKINEIQTSKVNSVEEDSKAMASSYQTRYEHLYREYLYKRTSQEMITNSLNAMANYNLAFFS